MVTKSWSLTLSLMRLEEAFNDYNRATERTGGTLENTTRISPSVLGEFVREGDDVGSTAAAVTHDHRNRRLVP